MELSNKTTKIFIHHNLLSSKAGMEKLQELFFLTREFPNSLIIKEIKENGELNIIKPTSVQERYSLEDNHFQLFLIQMIVNGYLYGTVESFNRIIGNIV